jgi:hypothetical protein
MRFTKTIACITAVAGVAVAGCGGSAQGGNAARFHGDQQKVASVVDRLAAASRNSDGAQICDQLFTLSLRLRVQKAAGASCAAEVARKIGAKDASFAVRTVDVKKSQAAAVVVDQAKRASKVFLTRDGGDWRIARITAA